MDHRKSSKSSNDSTLSKPKSTTLPSFMRSKNTNTESISSRSAPNTDIVKGKDAASNIIVKEKPVPETKVVNPTTAPRPGGRFTVGNVGDGGVLYLRPAPSTMTDSRYAQSAVPHKSGPTTISKSLLKPSSSSTKTRDSLWTTISKVGQSSKSDSTSNAHSPPIEPSIERKQSISTRAKIDLLQNGTNPKKSNKERKKSADANSDNASLYGSSLDRPTLGNPRNSTRGLPSSPKTRMETKSSVDLKSRGLGRQGSVVRVKQDATAQNTLNRRHSTTSLQDSPGMPGKQAATSTFQVEPLTNGAISSATFEDLSHHESAPTIVKVSPITGEITAATVARIVAQVTSENVLDYELLSDFFLTVRCYMSTFDLCDYLMSRFEWAMTQQGTRGSVIRVRTFAAIRHWILNYFSYDFLDDEQLRIKFCYQLNYLARLVQSRSTAESSDSKLIQDLKKCWNGRISLFWTTDLQLDPNAEVLPGDISGFPSPQTSPSSLQPSRVRKTSRTQPGYSQSVAQTAAITSIAFWYDKVMNRDDQLDVPQITSSRQSVHNRNLRVVPRSDSLENLTSTACADSPRQLKTLNRGISHRSSTVRKSFNASIAANGQENIRARSRPATVHRDGSAAWDRSFSTTQATRISKHITEEELEDDDVVQFSILRGNAFPPDDPHVHTPNGVSSHRVTSSAPPSPGGAPRSEKPSVSVSGPSTYTNISLSSSAPSVKHLISNIKRVLNKHSRASHPPQLNSTSSKAVSKTYSNGNNNANVKPVQASPQNDTLVIRKSAGEDRVDSLAEVIIATFKDVATASKKQQADDLAAEQAAEIPPVPELPEKYSRRETVTQLAQEDKPEQEQPEKIAELQETDVEDFADKPPKTDIEQLPELSVLIPEENKEMPTLRSQPSGKLRRRPGGDLKAKESARDLAAPRKRISTGDFGATVLRKISPLPDGLAATDLPILETNDDALQAQTPVVDGSLTIPGNQKNSKTESDQRISYIRTHSSVHDHQRPSWEATMKKFKDLPDYEDEGGIEATLLKLEGKYEKPASPMQAEFGLVPFLASLSSSPNDTNGVKQEYRERTVDLEPPQIMDLPATNTNDAGRTFLLDTNRESSLSEESLPLLDRPISSKPRARPVVKASTDVPPDDNILTTPIAREPPSFLPQSIFDDDTSATDGPESLSFSDTSLDTSTDNEHDEEPAMAYHRTAAELYSSTPISPQMQSRIVDFSDLSQLHPVKDNEPTTTPFDGHLPGLAASSNTENNSSDHDIGKAPNLTPSLKPRHMPFVLAWDAETLVEQFTIIEQDALNEIDWRDLVDMRWQSSPTVTTNWVSYLLHRDPIGVDLVTARFNIVVKWALSEIVLTQDIEERAMTIRRYIRIAWLAWKCHNYATLLQITIALTSSDCTRLSKTWAIVPQIERDLLSDLELLVSPRRNFYMLRAEMDKIRAEEGCIPILALCIHDLTYNAQKPAQFAPFDDHGEALINFERFRTSAGIVKNLLRLIDASTRYNFAPKEGVIGSCLWMCSLEDEVISSRSKALEGFVEL